MQKQYRIKDEHFNIFLFEYLLKQEKIEKKLGRNSFSISRLSA